MNILTIHIYTESAIITLITSISVIIAHDICFPFSQFVNCPEQGGCVTFPTACSKPERFPWHPTSHTTHVALAGSPYFTISAGGVNTGLFVQLESVRNTLNV